MNSVILNWVYQPTMWWLSSTWSYFNEIVWSVAPTATFLYDNILTNPIFYWILIVVLILSLITFSD